MVAKFSLPLVAGAVVCTQKWRGELKEGDWLKISGERVEGTFRCADREGAVRWVVQTNLVWMPVGEQLRRSLRPGMLVGVAGDSKWYTLLGIAADGT